VRRICADEPRILVHAAAESGQDVRGIGVAGIFCLLDRIAQLRAERLVALDQRRDMRLQIHQIGRVGFDIAALRNHFDGSLRQPAENDHPLGHQVSTIPQAVGNLVHQLVNADESLALHVPVCLLGREGQCDGIGKAAIQEVDHRGAGLLGQSFGK
jgi:hypothetical protein